MSPIVNPAPHLATSFHTRAWVVAVLCVAFGLRAGFVVYRVVTDPSSSQIVNIPGKNDDQVDYDTTAKNLLAGRGFWSSDRGGSPYVAEPGYPLVLALLYLLLGKNLFLVKMAQALLSTATCYLVFRIGKETKAEKAGLVGALLLGVHPNHVYYPAFILSETVRVFAVALMMLFVVRAVASPSNRSFLWAGLAGGAAASTRIVVLPYLFVMAGLLVVLRRRDRLPAWPAGLFLVAGLAVLAPWSVRNYLLTGVLSPVRPDVGQMLVDASDPYSLERLENRPDFKATRRQFMKEDSLRERERLAESGVIRSLLGVGRLWYARFAEAPQEMATLLGRRFLEFWKLYPRGGDFAFPAAQAYSFLVNLIMIVFGIVGAVRSDLSAGVRGSIVVLVAVFLGVHLLYHTVPMRYRMPIEPALLLLAGAGLVRTVPRALKGLWLARP